MKLFGVLSAVTLVASVHPSAGEQSSAFPREGKDLDQDTAGVQRGSIVAEDGGRRLSESSSKGSKSYDDYDYYYGKSKASKSYEDYDYYYGKSKASKSYDDYDYYYGKSKSSKSYDDYDYYYGKSKSSKSYDDYDYYYGKSKGSKSWSSSEAV